MSKRQALGTISLNNQNNVAHNAPVGFGKPSSQQTNKFFKTQSFSTATVAAASALLNKIKPSNSLNKLNNDENSQLSSHKFVKPGSSDDDFEIFTENCHISFPSKRHPSTSSSSSGASSCMYDFFIKDDDKENSTICDKKKNDSSPEQLPLDEKSVDMILESPILFEETIKSASAINHACLLSDEEECVQEEEDEDDEAVKREQESELTLFNLIDYKRDCINYMRKLELEFRPKANYMKKQLDITSSMRAILIDWLVEVAEEYKLNMETLYLAVNYTDRFLSEASVMRHRLQLVGTASMYVASKYEEITPPDVNEFVYITDDTYQQKQVLRMEHLLLKTLGFRVSRPTANWFLNAYLSEIKLHECESKCGGGSAGKMSTDLFQRVEYLARYLAELTLLDCEIFLAYLPSQIAAAAIYLAMYTLERPWSTKTAELTGYKFDLSELKPCIWDLFKWYKQAKELPQQAIQEKYKQAKYEHISLVDPPEHLPACFYTNV